MIDAGGAVGDGRRCAIRRPNDGWRATSTSNGSATSD